MTVGNGKKISISHVGYATLPTSSPNPLFLNHVLHTPAISNNLLSVTKLCSDNRAFVEFFPTYFLAKDQVTKKVLLQGQLEHGLYKVHSPTSIPKSTFSNSQVFIASIKDPNLWHRRLGHPSLPIVKKV